MKYIRQTSSPSIIQTPYPSPSTLTLVLSHFNFWNLVLIFYRSSAVALLLAPNSTPLDFVSRSVVCLYRRPRTSVPASLSLILTTIIKYECKCIYLALLYLDNVPLVPRP